MFKSKEKQEDPPLSTAEFMETVTTSENQITEVPQIEEHDFTDLLDGPEEEILLDHPAELPDQDPEIIRAEWDAAIKEAQKNAPETPKKPETKNCLNLESKNKIEYKLSINTGNVSIDFSECSFELSSKEPDTGIDFMLSGSFTDYPAADKMVNQLYQAFGELVDKQAEAIKQNRQQNHNHKKGKK